jgi:hypothetical protein
MVRPLLVDTMLLNPNATEHPNKVDLRYWYTDDTLSGADTLPFLEPYPKSEIDTSYHPNEYVGTSHPVYRLSGSEDGKLTKVFLSDDSTYVLEPMAYFFSDYEMELMVPFNNEAGFKSARIHLAWIDSLEQIRTIDNTPEAKTLLRYAVLGGLLMLVIIGSQNGLF